MKILRKDALPQVLAEWSRTSRVLTPTLKPQGDVIFDDFEQETFTLAYGKPSMPLKSLLSPQTETILSVRQGRFQGAPQAGPTIIFGLRACDLMGIRQATSFMTRDMADVNFHARAQACLYVVMACAGAQNETCFCTTTRSGPWSAVGFDLQFYDQGDHFLVDPGSERGRALLESGPFAACDTGAAQDARRRFQEKAASSIREVPEVVGAMERLALGGNAGGVWEYFGGKCIACGGCAAVCPTCTCFTLNDRVEGPGQGERIRTWDSCLFEGFTREASGHNPRPSQALRLKRRHEHKLRFYHPDDICEALCGCVGCGRCSDFCPVHIGTLEVCRLIAGQAEGERDGR